MASSIAPVSSLERPRRVARTIVRAGRLAWHRIQLAALQATAFNKRRQRRRAFASSAPGKPVTLFLAPEAGLEPFYASHVILARVLQDAGHPVLILSCNGLQPTCSLKIAMHIGPTKPDNASNPACVRCRTAAFRVGAAYGLPDIPLEELIDDARRREIESVMAEYTTAPWEAMYDGIIIGAGCLGEALRAARKVAITDLDDKDIAFMQALLYAALAVYIAVRELGSRYNIRRIAYFGDYAYFLAPQVYAAQRNIPLTNVCHAYHRDTDRRFLNLWPTHAAVHQLEQVRRWEQYQTAVIDPKTVADIADGALYRLYGHGGISTYSPNWSLDAGDLPQKLGLPTGGELLVAYTNSTDEWICHQHSFRTLGDAYDTSCNPFPTQIEWLQQLIAWVGQHSDLRLILRLHPRMAASVRYNNLASEYRQMRELFTDLPGNIAVVWPESPLSSYNLVENAAIALTAWSSIGLELARFGIPVIAAFHRIGPFPRSSFIGFEETPASYFSAIERALDHKPDLANIVGAFRWTHFLHWTPLVDVADVVPSPDYAGVPPFRTPSNAATLLDVMADGADIIALNMARLPTGPDAVGAEQRAVLDAIEKFIVYFMTGRIDRQRGQRLNVDRNDTVTLIDGHRTITRPSRLAARLLRVLEASRAPVDA